MEHGRRESLISLLYFAVNEILLQLQRSLIGADILLNTEAIALAYYVFGHLLEFVDSENRNEPEPLSQFDAEAAVAIGVAISDKVIPLPADKRVKTDDTFQISPKDIDVVANRESFNTFDIRLDCNECHMLVPYLHKYTRDDDGTATTFP